MIEKMSGESKKEAEDIVHRFEEAGRDLFEWVPGALDVLKYLDGSRYLLFFIFFCNRNFSRKNIPRAIITRNSQISIDLLNEHLEIAKIPFFDINLGKMKIIYELLDIYLHQRLVLFLLLYYHHCLCHRFISCYLW